MSILNCFNEKFINPYFEDSSPRMGNPGRFEQESYEPSENQDEGGTYVYTDKNNKTCFPPVDADKTSRKYSLAKKVGIIAFAVLIPVASVALGGFVYMTTHGGVIHNITQGFNLAKDWVVNQVKNMIHSKPMQDMIHFAEKSGQTIKADVTKWGQIAIQDIKNAGQATASFVSKHRLEFGLGFGFSGTFVAGAIAGVVVKELKPLQKMGALRAKISGCTKGFKLPNFGVMETIKLIRENREPATLREDDHSESGEKN